MCGGFWTDFQATCFTRPIGYSNDPAYSGDFPCTLYNCPGCPHQLVAGQNNAGFPFDLEDEIGKGGFASVYRGRFHQGHAAFKFVPIKKEQTYTYDTDEVGCYEYHQQEMVMNHDLVTGKNSNCHVNILYCINHNKVSCTRQVYTPTCR